MILDTPSKNQEYDNYVNHDLSVQLDSTDAFEGPEKLLEIWFAPDPESLPSDAYPNGLRSVSRANWETMLDIVKCKVLSTVSSRHMDAFLLSESSMFVFPHKLILKTCGTTTTLIGIPSILDIASSVGLTEAPWRVFYSRKSFMFPEMQLHPHRSWEDEVAFLDNYFGNGSSYMVGNTNADHWHLYTTEPSPKFPHIFSGTPSSEYFMDFQDETLEVLMTDLDPSAAAQFFTHRLPGAEKLNFAEDVCGMSDVESSSSLEDSNHDDQDTNSSHVMNNNNKSHSNNGIVVHDDPGHELGALVTKHAKIDEIYHGVNQTIDSFGFTPCGYSCNTLVGNDGGHYFTIHVTPEKGFSYASFESNVPAGKYGITNSQVLERVVNIFKPGKFSLTLFEAHSKNGSGAYKIRNLFQNLSGYKRTDRIIYEFDGYDLVFMSFAAR